MPPKKSKPSTAQHNGPGPVSNQNSTTGRSNSDEENNDPNATDTENAGESEILGPRQDPRERRDIRHIYNDMKDAIQANREDLIRPGSDGLHKQLERADEVFTKRVKETREAAMDSGVVALISQLAKQQVQALHTDFCVFDPVEFSHKLITLIGGNQLPDTERERARISREGWIKLGEAAQPFFKRSPALHCMYGTFERGPPKQKVKAVRTQEKKDDGSAQKGPTEPKQLTSFKDMDEKQEVTTQEVEKMLKALQHWYHKAHDEPICYFSFIVNPDSFGLTIENMFYASFLVRDGLARISLDDDKLPVIEPVEKTTDADQVGQLPRHQVVMTMTQAEWMEIVKTFKITKAMIKPREPLLEPQASTSGTKRKNSNRR